MSAEPVRDEPGRHEPPRWLPYLQWRLDALVEGLGTAGDEEYVSPDPAALRRALPEVTSLLEDGTSTPSVVPTVDGGVQFAWRKAGWDVEIEVLATTTLAWVRQRSEGPGLAGPVGEMREPLDQALRALVSAP